MTEGTKARFWEKAEGGKVRCSLCAHRCLIGEKKRGICGVRENRGGILYSLVYGKAIAANVDPIEKKPLFHFLPGTRSFSLAAAGCNFRCRNCQNADISQMPRETGEIAGSPLPPERAAAEAERLGCRSVSYTYTEPTIFFEYAADTAVAAKGRGLKNIFVSNGYMTAEALAAAGPWLDAANVDLKFFRDESYRTICGARLQPVLDTIASMKKRGIWVEVTTLVIPGHNDSDEELKEIASFLVGIGKEIPWHVSAFHPTYRLTDAVRTPAAVLARARSIGLSAGLRYVYTGNLPGDGGENTFCSRCGKEIVSRSGFQVTGMRIREGKCGFCGEPVAGVWD
jgi:pyruvate formate lyase activating enzyme